jgi:hypothetical protein
LEGLEIGRFRGTGDDEIEIGEAGSDVCKAAQEQVAALFWMDTAEEEQKAPGGKAGEAPLDGFELDFAVVGWRSDAEGSDHSLPSKRKEGAGGAIEFFFGGEDDAGGLVQTAAHQRPEQGLFDVFPQIAVVEPGVEHAVRIDEVGNAAGERGAHGNGGMLP